MVYKVVQEWLGYIAIEKIGLLTKMFRIQSIKCGQIFIRLKFIEINIKKYI